MVHKLLQSYQSKNNLHHRWVFRSLWCFIFSRCFQSVFKRIIRPVSLPAAWPWIELPKAAYDGGVHMFEISEKQVNHLVLDKAQQRGEKYKWRKSMCISSGSPQYHIKMFWVHLWSKTGWSIDQRIWSVISLILDTIQWCGDVLINLLGM